MKQSGLIAISIFIAIAIAACGNTNSTKNNDTIAKLLEKQLQTGMSWGNDEGADLPNAWPYGKEDLIVTSELMYKQLAERGFKSNPSLFRQRVKEIFAINLDTMPLQIDMNYNTYHVSDTIEFKLFDHEVNSTILLSPKENILLFPYYIPEIIDYKKLYPDIAQLEDTLSTTREDELFGKVTITKWGDLKDLLDKQREYNINNLFHANNYLIYNREESFNWLLENNATFISQLLTPIGYDKDDRINKYVLGQIPKEDDSYERYAWYHLEPVFTGRAANGKLQIRENLLKYMHKNANNEYAEMLYTYGNQCIDMKYDFNSDFTKDERFEIAAYMAYYLRLIYIDNLERSGGDSDYIFIGDMLFRAIGDEINEDGNPSNQGVISVFLEAIVNHNYYNLPNFKEMIDSIIEDCRDMQQQPS